MLLAATLRQNASWCSGYIACKRDELDHDSWLAVVAKATDLRGTAAGSNSCVTIANQILQAFTDPVTVPPNARPVYIDRVWVVTSGEIPTDALSKVEHRINQPGLARAVRWVPGDRLVRLVDKHSPHIWVELAAREET